MKNNKEKPNFNKTKKLLYLLGIAAIFSAIPFFSADLLVRIEVKNRSNGRCEGCNKKVKYKDMICAHMNHKVDKDYNNPDKLKAFCICCEAKYHISNMRKPRKIGLRLIDNTATSNGLWLTILKRGNPEEIKDILYNYEEELIWMYKRLKFNTNHLKSIKKKYPRKIVNDILPDTKKTP